MFLICEDIFFKYSLRNVITVIKTDMLYYFCSANGFELWIFIFKITERQVIGICFTSLE